VTPKILLKQDPARINTCGNDIHLTGLTMCRGMNKPRECYGDQALISAISGAAFVVEKAWFEKLGGFDEPFMMYMEETDLSIRSRLAGRGCLYVPNAIVHHAYELRFGPEKTYYQERNRYWTLLKNFRTPTLILLIPALMVGELVTWGFVLLKDRSRWQNKITAYGWVLKNWGRIMESRRQAQALRQVKDRDLILAHSFKLDFEQTHTGVVAVLAHLVFDTFFFISYYILFGLIWW
jgi:GT2 family glycosyltransferase